MLLVSVALLFARLEFRVDLSSALFSTARERIMSVSRLAALQLPDVPSSEWTQLLEGYSRRYPAHFYLFREDGTQVAGEPVQLPPEFASKLSRHPFGHPARMHLPPHDGPLGAEGEHFRHPPPPPGPPMEPGNEPRHREMPIDFFKSSNPSQYWAGVSIPIWIPDRDDPIHGVMVWRFGSLWTERFFFDARPWIGIVALVIFISAICWIPLVRGLTRTIRSVTEATGQVADGRFDVQLPVVRRDELGLLSESINRMAARLAGYVHGQKRFLGDIAHELSSPLARMQLALGILEQRTGEEAAAYVADLREEAEHMSRLVSELLSFSKQSMLRTEAELKRVPVGETVDRVLSRERSEGVSIQTRLEENLEAIADPEYLFRALANVVRNAIRYAGDAGPIEISGKRRNERVQIRVADQGPGIPENELENVFRPFYRPEFARMRETGGTGLGLAIVRDCVEACGGHVECRNRAPHGLEVLIDLAAG